MAQFASTSFFSIPKFFAGDLAFFVFLFAIFFILTVYFGRGVIVSFILGFYITIVLYSTLPSIEKFIFLSGEKLVLLNTLLIFSVILLPLTIIINRYIYSPSEYSSSIGMLKAVAYSIASSILVVAFSYMVIDYDLFHDFSAIIDSIFTYGWGGLIVLLVPLIILAIL